MNEWREHYEVMISPDRQGIFAELISCDESKLFGDLREENVSILRTSLGTCECEGASCRGPEFLTALDDVPINPPNVRLDKPYDKLSFTHLQLIFLA